MSEAKHDLATEFPEMKDTIHTLKTTDAHFQRLFNEYHDLNKSIHRSEQRLDTISEFEEERLRKKRLMIKDELYSMLVTARKSK